MTRAAKRWVVPAIWLVVGVLTALLGSVQLPSAQLNGEYIPVGNDSFYHARRIVDAVHDPSGFYQFDSKIHAPEGSLLVWPWGYDYLMSVVVRVGMAIGLSADPIAILVWIPVAAVFIYIALIAIISRQMKLSSWLTALALLCTAVAPSTKLLFSVGEIDHHFAEVLLIVGSLAAGLAWLQNPTSRTSVILGITLGFSVAIHNGLFILQIPLLLSLFVLWLQGWRPPQRATLVFAGALLVSTAVALVPSLPFRLGKFEFHTLSWFHGYIAVVTAALTVFFSRTEATRKNVAGAILIAVVAGAGVLGQVQLAGAFLAGTPKALQNVLEMRSPLALVTQDPAFVTKFYSLLIWCTPLTLALCVWQCWRKRATPELLFWLTGAWGLCLLLTQLRMHYFGVFALYLPWLVMLQRFAEERPQLQRNLFLGASLALLLGFGPQLRYEVLQRPPVAADVWYERVAPLFPILRDACADDPGIVLADSNAGHYIRYATDCSVIANNFLLTPEHFRKVDQVDELFALSAAELVEAPPQPKYVLVRPADILRLANGQYTFTFFGDQPRLAQELLFAPPESMPRGYRLLGTIPLPNVPGVAYAKLFKIERDGPGSSPPSPSAP